MTTKAMLAIRAAGGSDRLLRIVERQDMTQRQYEALFRVFEDEMPYGTRKARTGDPYVWILNRLDFLP